MYTLKQESRGVSEEFPIVAYRSYCNDLTQLIFEYFGCKNKIYHYPGGIPEGIILQEGSEDQLPQLERKLEKNQNFWPKAGSRFRRRGGKTETANVNGENIRVSRHCEILREGWISDEKGRPLYEGDVICLDDALCIEVENEPNHTWFLQFYLATCIAYPPYYVMGSGELFVPDERAKISFERQYGLRNLTRRVRNRKGDLCDVPLTGDYHVDGTSQSPFYIQAGGVGNEGSVRGPYALIGDQPAPGQDFMMNALKEIQSVAGVMNYYVLPSYLEYALKIWTIVIKLGKIKAIIYWEDVWWWDYDPNTKNMTAGEHNTYVHNIYRSLDQMSRHTVAQMDIAARKEWGKSIADLVAKTNENQGR